MRETFLPYFRPTVEDEEVAAVVDTLRNGWLTTGPKTVAFEEAFAAASGAKFAIALNSCTAGLHLGLVALGVGPGDEVIMPSLTFVAGAQCARQLGARPVFCDVDSETLCISAESVKRVFSRKTKVIIPMQYAGYPLDIAPIIEFAMEQDVAVLEDAAHALGTVINGQWAGMKSAGAAYSFYATKNITSAEGGMFVTNNERLAAAVRTLSLHGMSHDAWKRYTKGGNWKYDVVATGYKYNMPDILAALGHEQLKKVDKFQRRREEIAAFYTSSLAAVPGVKPLTRFASPPDRHSWCMFVVTVDPSNAQVTRDELIDELRSLNIGTSVHYIPTHTFEAYRDPTTLLPITESMSNKILSLPLYPSMSDDDAADVASAIAGIVDRRRARRSVAIRAR